MVNDFIKQHSTAFFILALVIIAGIGLLVFNSLDKEGTRSVPLSTIPSDATVELNNVTTKLGNSTDLPLGTHTITVSKEGFLTKTTQIIIQKDQDYKDIEPVALVPLSDEAKKWAKENEELYGEFADSKTFLDPVFSYVPISNLLYSVDSDSTDTPVTLKLASLGNYKNAPIDHLKRSGIDPSNYLYTLNYSNPFKVGNNE